MVTHKIKNIYIIGSSHISIQSINEVKNFIINQRPDIVALELDHLRFESLTSKERKKFSLLDIKEVGVKGYLFNIFGSYIQKKLGEMVGVDPGSEMIAAINLAKEHKINICLVDQDIRITLRRLSTLITFKEKCLVLVDIIKSPFRKKIYGFDFSKIDLSKVPEERFITAILSYLKHRYPSFYRVLILERNNVIAKNLNRIIEDNKDSKILVVLGAGHIPGLMKLIKIGEY